MSDLTLDVQGLSTHFHTRGGVVKAVEDISFSVPRGRVLGLVGESGSGKSVTGFSVIGLVDPPGRIVSGKILFQGRDLTKLDERELRDLRGNRIAMIFQDPMMTLNPVLRVDTQMIETVLAHENVSREEARTRSRDALGMVGIPSPDERLVSYPHQFSGGMRQRVAIAIALLHRPDLIIADEPTTALDVTVQQQILALLQQARSELGSAILYISHDLAVVTHLCDRILIMYAGEIVEQGPTRTLFRSPKHPYTQGLLASIPSLHGDVQEYLPAIPGLPPNAAALPTGCRFAARCTFVQERCRAHHPELVSVGSHHAVRCILYEATTP